MGSNDRKRRLLVIPLAVACAAVAWPAGALLYGVSPSRAGDLADLLAGRTTAARLRGAALTHDMACHRGYAMDCAIAAAMLREGDPEDLVRAARLSGRATVGFGSQPITPIDDLDLADRAEVARRRERACLIGDAESCLVAAGLVTGDGRAFRAAALQQLACDAGDPRACETALRTRQAARR